MKWLEINGIELTWNEKNWNPNKEFNSIELKRIAGNSKGNEWLNAWMHGMKWMEWMNGWMEWLNGTNEWMHAWMDGWDEMTWNEWKSVVKLFSCVKWMKRLKKNQCTFTLGWTSELMNEWLAEYVNESMNEGMSEWRCVSVFRGFFQILQLNAGFPAQLLCFVLFHNRLPSEDAHRPKL